MAWRSLDEAKLLGVRALVRVDFNVPMSAGRVTDDTRLLAAMPTIRRLSAAGAKVALLAHFDRPKGRRVPEMSLEPVAKRLAELLGQPVTFVEDCVGERVRTALDAAKPGDVLLLENLRFHAGEETNDPAFARELAANATSTSTTPSRPRTAPTPRPRRWRALLPSLLRRGDAPAS